MGQWPVESGRYGCCGFILFSRIMVSAVTRDWDVVDLPMSQDMCFSLQEERK